ncbi:MULTISPECIES: hypothetical protein [Candidatus Cardinium]|uniref:hypothetical protein n=1 Tax=Candidatus Cardinium TaxID=273135 RepID=UPI001FAA6330|nr:MULTISPECIES: hypothetical protein [Cardinium]
MKKTYTRCRVGLFAGLLALNTLSSCVNTKQKLGWDRHRHRHGVQAGLKRYAGPIFFTTLGVAAGTGLCILWNTSTESNQGIETALNGMKTLVDNTTDIATTGVTVLYNAISNTSLWDMSTESSQSTATALNETIPLASDTIDYNITESSDPVTTTVSQNNLISGVTSVVDNITNFLLNKADMLRTNMIPNSSLSEDFSTTNQTDEVAQ